MKKEKKLLLNYLLKQYKQNLRQAGGKKLKCVSPGWVEVKTSDADGMYVYKGQQIKLIPGESRSFYRGILNGVVKTPLLKRPHGTPDPEKLQLVIFRYFVIGQEDYGKQPKSVFKDQAIWRLI